MGEQYQGEKKEWKIYFAFGLESHWNDVLILSQLLKILSSEKSTFFVRVYVLRRTEVSKITSSSKTFIDK